MSAEPTSKNVTLSHLEFEFRFVCDTPQPSLFVVMKDEQSVLQALTRQTGMPSRVTTRHPNGGFCCVIELWSDHNEDPELLLERLKPSLLRTRFHHLETVTKS